jgi:N-acyl-D-amino-acid deacylase
MTKRLISFFLLLAFAATFAVPALPFQVDYDLLITNARIIDGTGNPWYRGSIAVRNGRIVRIGAFDASNVSAKVTIDAGNRIVAPGFIDVHAHTESIYGNPTAENFIRMGVTTLITGNCGGSVVDVREFLGKIDAEPLAVNLGTLIGHNSVRSKVLGLSDVQPTVEQQAEMNGLVEEAMKEGALGLSTGLIYLPGTFAKTEEVVELARVAARSGGVYASHIRSEGLKVVDAVNEAINIGELADLPVEISHFKISSGSLWGQSDLTIGLVRAARERGVQVSVDQYAYTASSTSLDARFPTWAVAGGRDEGRKRIDDPETHDKIVKELKEYLKKNKFKDFSFAYVAGYGPNPGFNGKNIAEITKEVRGSKKVSAQIEQMFEMYKAGGAQMVYRVMDEADVRNIMRQPFTMIASDSGVRDFGVGAPHPRGYGNNARVLGKYVRELNLIPLEDAVRKMSSLPAQTFRLTDRGLLKTGYWADIVIFDEKTVGDLATFDKPHQYAKGFSSIIVNGRVVFDGEKMTGAMPGQSIYGPGKR